MVHHFCFFRPFRTFFGLMLIIGALLCFVRATERSRFEMRPARLAHGPATRYTYRPIDDSPGPDQVVTARAEPVTAPAPKPPAPSSGNPSARPDWVGKRAGFESRGGIEVYVTTVTAGPYSSDEECDRALGAVIDQAIADYAEKEFPHPAEGTVKLDSEIVQHHLIQDRYRQTLDSSVGPMRQEDVLLVFDAKIRSAIEHQWRAIVVASRLQIAAIGSGAVLLILGGVYSLLRLKPRP